VPVVHIPHERKLSFKNTAEPLAYQAELLPTAILAELQHLHNINTCEGVDFDDVDDELEVDGLTITQAGIDQNMVYDGICGNDAAAKWLRMAGMK
jgi:hypothetical protein